MKNKILVLVTILLLGAGLATTTAVKADDTTSSNPMDSLVQKISDKFGLNGDEVQAVFDEYHTERQAEMQQNREERQVEMEAKFQERLTQLVSDGKITEEQKQLIIAKHEELQAQRDTNMQNMQDKTLDERRTAMEQERAELETWANDNGIDPTYLMGGFSEGFGGHDGMGKFGGRGQNSKSTQS